MRDRLVLEPLWKASWRTLCTYMCMSWPAVVGYMHVRARVYVYVLGRRRLELLIPLGASSCAQGKLVLRRMGCMMVDDA